MTQSGRRSVRSVVAITVIVGLASSLVGCANLGPVTPVAVSDINSTTREVPPTLKRSWLAASSFL